MSQNNEMKKEESSDKTAAQLPSSENQATPSITSTEPSLKPSRKKRILNLLLDGALILLIIGIMSGSIWKFQQTMAVYSIPNPMDNAKQENNQLVNQLEAIVKKGFAADENIQLKKKLESLKDQIIKQNIAIETQEQAIQKLDGDIIKKQNHILSLDKQNRSIARQQLLPGRNIGSLRTKSGKIYSDAAIRRIRGNTITLRHSEGQTNINLDDVSSEHLGQLARYAFNFEDLVDCSDFIDSKDKKQAVSAASAKKKTKPKPQRGRIILDGQDYEPESADPVVDTKSAQPSSSTSDDGLNQSGFWQAPIEALPF